MKEYNIVVSAQDSTVVSEYTPDERKSSNYQSEYELEQEFIELLKNQGYTYINITSETDIINNLRVQLEKLNNIKFTDAEWAEFFNKFISNKEEGIIEKTRKIQEERVFEYEFSNGEKRNIKIIDDKNIHNNSLQVLNQYEVEGKRKNIYDVTILINGLPIVHIELKRRGEQLREAFNQINRYQRDSFWANSGLYEYIQIFVISNGTLTKYYSNTVRENHINLKSKDGIKKEFQKNYKFTNFWADTHNKIITDLIDFTRTFFQRSTLLNILIKYCVFNTSNQLMVMRPYQIVATEKILNKVKIANNYKTYGTKKACGYIFHTTGSGKTLTSFKTAKLITEELDVDKVIFVVDRQDLDYQTMQEFDKFKKGCVDGNSSTRILTQQLENPTNRIIITTIQKLNVFIKKNENHELYGKKVVFIFDECHRSQFGDMHTRITKKFKKHYLFGFTGTPIYAKNANTKDGITKTTEYIFGEELHKYTIVDAINDHNVLAFKIDYINTIKNTDRVNDSKVEAINHAEALMDTERIDYVVDYILQNYNQKTLRNNRGGGFNSLLAVSSIPMAIKYYDTFKKKDHDITIAMIYSYSQNEDTENLTGIIDEEDTDSTSNLDKSSRDYLELAIQDYNMKFGTNFNTGDNFKNYYKHLSGKVKDRSVDILIVVNMFLTGFDAVTLNTLWIDKNVQYHGLLQAYSRTNRIHNDLKTHGNIVTFRNNKKELDESLELFASGLDKGVILIRPFQDYYEGYTEDDNYVQGYKDLITELKTNYKPEEQIQGETAQREFIKLYGKILKLRHLLKSFNEFEEKEKEQETISERDLQDYQSIYLELYDQYKSQLNSEKVRINEDIVFEIELVRRDEINIDYILKLISKYAKTKDKNIITEIDRSIESSISLRSKKQLIEEFIKRVNIDTDVNLLWKEHVEEQKQKDVEGLIEEFNGKLENNAARNYIEESFKLEKIIGYGVEFDKIFRVSRFNKETSRDEIKKTFLGKLYKIFEKYFDM